VGERIADVSRRVAERNSEVSWEQGSDGRVTLRRQRYGAVRARLVGLMGEPPEFTIKLDPLGGETWLLIDGKLTVAQLKAALERAHPTEGDLGPRLGKFLGTMVSHDMVRLV
jgi:hypothetical protein